MSGLLGCLLGASACSDNPDAPVSGEEAIGGDGASEFVSSPAGGNRGPGDALSGAAESADAPPANAALPDQDTTAGGAERAISEADILQLSGDRLYALSRYSGLTVIDASNPSSLRVEGVYRSAAEPFEMYVEDGLVYAMFNGWYTYSCDAAGFCTWQTEARVQAIDARNPQNIQVLADLEVPGYIADSRRVGDIMYLATEQWGGCWGCEAESNTTITSFNVSNPARFEQLDQLRLPSAGDYGGSRSISVTSERIYIGGYDYDADVNYAVMPGTIRVVDISDPGGALEEGASFGIAGPIQSRWQMDEFDGVFRVISQPGGWGGERPPVVQTFTVNSSTDIAPAGSLTIELPRPREVLQSVRFDGARAYAITAEQRDPLFTFDLSNPAAPLQLGELEMPGWVYHMEPRGNRIYALGNDPQNPDGSLHVSLFDVTDLANPILLSRVAFGGDWGSFAEGQNQIHKAFNILPEQGLILVPFSGGNYDEETCEYDYGSGIQLVDFTDTTLTRRGVAPQVGAARRALLHRDRLFGIGDNAVQTFDISNRDQPVETGQLDVARNVSTVRVLGDHLLRFGSDWLTNQTILDMTPVSQASSAEPQAEIDLSELFGADQWSCNGSAYWSGQVFTRGNYAYVPRFSYSWDRQGGGSSQQLTLYIVDLADRNAPRVAGSFAVEPTVSNGNTNSYGYITGVIQTDDALLVGRSVGNYTYDSRTGATTGYPRFYYDVLELSDPEAPTVASRFEVPAEAASYGWGRWGVVGCMVDVGWGWYGGGESTQLTDGNLVVSQHAEPVPGTNGSQVKYYLDRIDVSDPYAPHMLPKVNIPGTAIHFDSDTGQLVTIDYQQEREAASNWQDCDSRGYYGYYDYSLDGSGSECGVVRRSLNALRIEGERAIRTAQVLLDRETRAGNIAVSDDRIFYTTSAFPEYAVIDVLSREAADVPVEMKPVMLETLRIGNGTITRLPAQELRRLPSTAGYYSQLYARGERVFEIFDSNVNVIDTVDPNDITRLTRELPGWGCSSLEVSGDAAYCAIGQRGVEVIDLSGMR